MRVRLLPAAPVAPEYFRFSSVGKVAAAIRVSYSEQTSPLPVEGPVAHVRTQKGAVHDLVRVHVSPVLIRDRIGVHHLFRGNRDPGGKLFRGIKVGDMGKDKGVDHQRFALGLQPGLERFPRPRS